MKKSQITFSLFFTIFMGLLLMNTTVASPGDRMHPPRRDTERMPGGMQGGSEYMDITGTVFVDDGVTISLSITPTDEMVERMEDRMQNNPNTPPLPDEITHTLNVTLYELVEFEDLNEIGYDVNDTIVSTYSLDQSSLGDVVESTNEDITTYSVSSFDGVFTLIVDVNVTDNIPHDWKWSLLIEYPFVSDTSDLALIHEIESDRANMIDRSNQYHERPRAGDIGFNPDNHMRYENHSMIAENEHIPIVFSWDTEVKVDGTTENVTATSFGDSFALSLSQGDVIDYDPKLSVDTETVNLVDNQYFEFFENGFANIINSPTALGITLATISTFVIVIILRRK